MKREGVSRSLGDFYDKLKGHKILNLRIEENFYFNYGKGLEANAIEEVQDFWNYLKFRNLQVNYEYTLSENFNTSLLKITRKCYV